MALAAELIVIDESFESFMGLTTFFEVDETGFEPETIRNGMELENRYDASNQIGLLIH